MSHALTDLARIGLAQNQVGNPCAQEGCTHCSAWGEVGLGAVFQAVG